MSRAAGADLMQSIMTTKEPIAHDTDQFEIDRDIQLRLRAGALRCWVEATPWGPVLMTDWDAIAED